MLTTYQPFERTRGRFFVSELRRPIRAYAISLLTGSLLLGLTAQPATANRIVITIGSGPDELAGMTGDLVGGPNGGGGGNISATGGVTSAAAAAAALAAASGGVANGNMVSYEGAVGGGAIMDAGLFSRLSVRRIRQPEPPPPVPPPVPPQLPQPPPGGIFIDVFFGPTIIIGGTIQKQINIGNTNNININVSFTPGQTIEQVNNDIFAELMESAALLPPGVNLTQVNSIPTILTGTSFFDVFVEDSITLDSPGNAGFGVGTVIGSPVPEPATGLMIVGALMTGYFVRRRLSPRNYCETYSLEKSPRL